MPILHDVIFQHFCWVKSAEYSHHLQLCNNKQHAKTVKNAVEIHLRNVQSYGIKLKCSNFARKMQNVPSCRPRAICKILKPACNWNNWQLYSLIKLQMFHFIRGLISRGSIRMPAGRVKNKTLQNAQMTWGGEGYLQDLKTCKSWRCNQSAVTASLAQPLEA